MSFAAATHAKKATYHMQRCVWVCVSVSHTNNVIAVLRSFSTSKAELPRGHPSHPVTVAHTRDPGAPTRLLSPQPEGGSHTATSTLSYTHIIYQRSKTWSHTDIAYRGSQGLLQTGCDAQKLNHNHTAIASPLFGVKNYCHLSICLCFTKK